MKTKIILCIALITRTIYVLAIDPTFVKDVFLQVDTSQYTLSSSLIQYRGNNCLAFQYNKENEVCNVKVFTDSYVKIKKIVVLESGDYDIIDSVVNINNRYFEFKVQFKHLTRTDFLKFRLNIDFDNSNEIQEINLFPFTNTFVRLNINDYQLSAGEEKIFELITNHPDNIVINPDWVSTPDFYYRIIPSNGQLFLHLLANSTGKRTFNLPLKVSKPFMFNNAFVYDLPVLSYVFNINAAGLVFLKTDKSDITMDENVRNDGIEVLIDNNPLLQQNKTYTIENQKNQGGRFIGTLYTRDRMSNNKMLCILRAYNFHRLSEGFLYLKDNDEARFITNFNVIPQTSIEKIKIMRNGTDWIEDATIYPGETFNLRIEGQSLAKAKFNFDELINLAADSVIRSDNFAEFKLRVPLNITKRNIAIFNYDQNTGKSLSVREYQILRPFDYIKVNYGNGTKEVSDIKGPELYDKTIKDVIISFSPEIIDAAKLYGKQYVTIDIKILGKKGELIDYTTIEDLAICPAENSPRFPYYSRHDCKNADISLNSKISNTTYSLKDWSRIRLTFKSSKDRYSTEPQTKTVEIVLQKRYQFDIDVSFPAGLLIKKMNNSDFGRFGGISMAVVAQYSFFDKEKINRIKPYKFGAGFLAINAFNYNKDAADRDMGVVFVGTLNPMNPDRKLSFPIYLGGGYLLSEKTWFWLIGPGISIQL